MHNKIREGSAISGKHNAPEPGRNRESAPEGSGTTASILWSLAGATQANRRLEAQSKKHFKGNVDAVPYARTIARCLPNASTCFSA